MKIFIVFALFYVANSANVEKRWGWGTTPDYWYTDPPPTEEPCVISEQAKFLESIIRVDLLLVKSTSAYALQEFFHNRTAELKNSLNSALQFFQFVADEPSLRLGFPEGNTGISRALSRTLNTLAQLNGTHAVTILRNANYDIWHLLHEVKDTHPYYLKRRMISLLRDALQVCSEIVKNGCKEEVKPTSDPWRTTREPGTPDPWRTRDPWRTTREPGTRDPWRPTKRPNWGTTRY